MSIVVILLMKVSILLSTACFICCQSVFAQKEKDYPIDSTLEANSERWKVKTQKGFKWRPAFGPYKTADVEKLDSPMIRKKTKVGSSSSSTYTSEGMDWDFSKYLMVEKSKAYRMLIVKETDTTELVFTVYSTSQEKRSTFFGDLMSKNDEGKNQVLAYKLNIPGFLLTPYDSIPWRFFMKDSFNRNGASTSIGQRRIIVWNLLTDKDSFYTEPIMYRSGSPTDRHFFEWQVGVTVRNAEGLPIAALNDEMSGPYLAWMRRDLETAQQGAVASLLALWIYIRASRGPDK